MLLGLGHFVIGACIELIAFLVTYREHRCWTALDPRLTHDTRPTFG